MLIDGNRAKSVSFVREIAFLIGVCTREKGFFIKLIVNNCLIQIGHVKCY